MVLNVPVKEIKEMSCLGEEVTSFSLQYVFPVCPVSLWEELEHQRAELGAVLKFCPPCGNTRT